jgi:hypothetical protein
MVVKSFIVWGIVIFGHFSSTAPTYAHFYNNVLRQDHRHTQLIEHSATAISIAALTIAAANLNTPA